MAALKERLQPVIDFGVRAAVGLLVFMIVSTAALLAQQFVELLASYGVNPMTRKVLDWCETVMFALDVTLFAVYLLYDAWQALREILKR